MAVVITAPGAVVGVVRMSVQSRMGSEIKIPNRHSAKRVGTT